MPEVNGDALTDDAVPGIVANPNCQTIQMVVALKPLHDLFTINRIDVTTFQAVSGSGKLAQDERGFIAKSGSKVWITGSSSKQNSHQLRSEVDAVLDGKNTVLIDNPELTVREVIGNNPKRIVLDTNRTLPYNFKLLNDAQAETIIMCSNNKFQDNKTSHCQYLVGNEKNNKLDPKDILIRLGEIGITSLIIEGGASTIKSFLDLS